MQVMIDHMLMRKIIILLKLKKNEINIVKLIIIYNY